MYNYQTFLRQQKIQSRCQQVIKDDLKVNHHREKSMPSLIFAHKKRVEGFILAMIEKPVQVKNYRDFSPCFRQSQKQKNISSNGFYLKRQTSTQRIKNAIQKNKQLDRIPFNNTFSHQFRQYNQGQAMKYQPFNCALRIKESLDKQTLNYLNNRSNQRLQKNIKKAQIRGTTHNQNLKKSIHKSFLPDLHQKTFFKSVSTLYSELPAPKQAKTIEIRDQQSQEQTQNKREAKGVQHFSRRQNSKQALIKCNILAKGSYRS